MKRRRGWRTGKGEEAGGHEREKRLEDRTGSLVLSCRYKRLFSALASLAGPVQDIFSSLYTISIPLSPSLSKLGRQPCWVSCLLVCVSGLDQLNLISRTS